VGIYKTPWIITWIDVLDPWIYTKLDLYQWNNHWNIFWILSSRLSEGGQLQ